MQKVSQEGCRLLNKLWLLPYVETVAQPPPWRVTGLWARGSSILWLAGSAVWKPWVGVVGKPFR
jgi:hypothetical protein